MTVEAKPRGRLRLNKEGQECIDKVEDQIDAFKDSVSNITLDKLNEAKTQETAPQTELSQKQISNSKDIYLKPKRYIGSKEKFNEKYRDKYNFSKEYVYFIAENKEVGGETIQLWTKPYAGLPAEFWEVPVNKPIWGPRYLAEQIKSCKYRRLKSEDRVTADSDGYEFRGQMVIDTQIQRLDAVPATKQRSVFTGGTSF